MDLEHTLMMNADYVLGLLPAEDRRRVENHTRHCAACRLALQREQGLAQLVRGTVQYAGRPAPGRLAALRPQAVAQRPRVMPFYLRLAPVTLVAFMIMVGLLFGTGHFTLAPAFYATEGTPTQTATVTHTPTATLAEVDAAAPPMTLAPPVAGSFAPRPAVALPGAPAAAATPIIQPAGP